MSVPNDSILYSFVRPSEPVNIPKNLKNKTVFFRVEDLDYLPERYRRMDRQPIAMRTLTTDPKTWITIQVKKLKEIPDLSLPLKLKPHEPFSLFIMHHSQMAARLIEVFIGMKTYDELLSIAVYIRNRLNSAMFIYALSVAIIHREDTKHLPIPSLAGVFPHKFVSSITLKKAYEEANVFELNKRKFIELHPEHTASDFEVEHRVAYFREDLGISLHHWHWHLVYPDNGCTEIVKKDRRGELFYYMHQYNFERFSNNLNHVESFSNWREAIPEGYFSKLGSDMGTGAWPGRHSGAVLKDVNLPNREFDIQHLDRSRDRIIEAIHLGFVTDVDGKPIKLDEFQGIDILGNIVEASVLSPNRIFYGNIHNNGHIAIGKCHDPDYRHFEGSGVMGSNETAMRDPIFYRRHTFVNNIFVEHKNLLPPYTKENLVFKDVTVDDIKVEVNGKISDSFETHWQQSDVDISGGLDFGGDGIVRFRFTHLNHIEFTYNITVTNESDSVKTGTFRIFMAPKFDESKHEFHLNKQRHLMIELDKFTATLNPGSNVIKRLSVDSSVTIPFEQTFPNLDKRTPDDSTPTGNYCGCGWPQHMLIPKGIVQQGLPIDLFVMVSDSAIDKVDQVQKTCCKNAVSFCGLRDKEYPDARAMGYPFDRRPSNGIDSLNEFLTKNMKVKEMSIIYKNYTVMPIIEAVPVIIGS